MNDSPDRKSTDKSTESLEDLVALFVAGAMTNEERLQFESRLLCDESLRKTLDSFRKLHDSLLDSIEPVPPSPDRKASLLAIIEDQKELTERSERILCRANSDDWMELGVPGITIRILFVDQENQRMTALLRAKVGAILPSHVHSQAEECLVLEGDIDFGDYVLHAGDYLRLPPNTKHAEARTTHGCLCLLLSELPESMTA